MAERLLIVLAALAGLLGVALSAAAAHVTGGGSLQTAAQFLLFHAPALLALVALGRSGAVSPKLARLAGYVLVVGLVLFCGDLTRRALAGEALAPMAAPTGGVMLMIGWVLAGVSALMRPRG
ncbi:DUF423 domain-containing protein [Microvirga pudoricolor]|uniref:DUF423 domain-containing protein n=1 Tax=Microvirga pudoricolor TaxID=2778729 RepID=UPI00194F2248|nr:DUF423 domain-containing protein [Microvirga pudoricolor]MBM6596222.1 DUF423 domain-containing protein [Microvirga pudoricolor]